MGERLEGEARERMQDAIKDRLALSDAPNCHCGCVSWQHEIEAEMRGGEAVILLQGHPSIYLLDCSCSGYDPKKDGVEGILQDAARGLQEFFKEWKTR